MKCPGEETLIAWAVSDSGAPDADLAAHVVACPKCRATVRAIHASMLCEEWANPEPCVERAPADVAALSSWEMPGPAPELLLYLNGLMSGGERVYATWSDALSCQKSHSRPQLAATRALGGEPRDRQPMTLSFSKQEIDCILQVGVDLTGQGATLRFELLSPAKRPILPFLLSVRDVETKRILLDRKEFKAGAAVLKGVECGSYVVKAEAGSKSCCLSFKVG